jgi:hypothetical protein
MRLIDLIAQTQSPFLVQRGTPPVLYRLRGAFDLVRPVIACPVRYILSDEVARTCAELAFSCGNQLIDCLDLVRIPAPSLWIEWSNAAALAGAGSFFDQSAPGDSSADQKNGLFIQSEPSGQRALVHGFWSESDEALACPLDASLDFREERDLERSCSCSQGWISVIDPQPAVTQLLDCARFRMDASWARYYETAGLAESERRRVVRDSLGGVARDVPLLVAFLLLLASREGVSFRAVSRESLNRKRVRNGHAPLMDHLEVSLALPQKWAAGCDSLNRNTGRITPRRHHVRAHLVRRHNRIFWRRAHVRGSVLRGSVLSRTVTLELG